MVRGGWEKAFWARRWLEALTRLGWRECLLLGRPIARAGRVQTLDVRRGRVLAQVKGRRRRPHTVGIRLRPLTGDEWARVIDRMAQQALFVAQVLVGDVPEESEGVFEQVGVPLFPTHDEIAVDCSCPGQNRDCQYAGAVLNALAEAFADDPFLLFKLRGCAKEPFLAQLKARRDEKAPEAGEDAGAQRDETLELEPVDVDLERFWAFGGGLGDFDVTIQAPSVETALLKRLGPPPFVRRPAAFKGTLSLVYASVTRRAQALAFEEHDAEDLA